MTVRILELTQRIPPSLGGVEQHVDHLARELLRAGFDVTISTTDLERDRPFARRRSVDAPRPFPVRRRQAVPAFPAPHGLGILAPGMLRDLLRSPSEVVHAHGFGFFPTWAAALARRLGASKLVITPHADAGNRTRTSRAYARIVTWATLRQADRIVAQSRGEAALLESWGVAPTHIEVIPTPIDLGEFPPSTVAKPSRARPVFLFVGRIYLAQKGLDLLVRAAALLGDAAPDLRFVGPDWGDAARLVKLAWGLGIADRVTVTGPLPRSDVLREFRNANAFVLPSRFDSFPVVLLEAMASGLPVVASRVGAVPEVVGDGESGLLVESDNVEALRAAVARLARDEALRARLGEEGRRRVEQYSWTRLGPRYAAMFRALTEDRTATPVGERGPGPPTHHAGA
jgi:glycogen synthase